LPKVLQTEESAYAVLFYQHFVRVQIIMRPNGCHVARCGGPPRSASSQAMELGTRYHDSCFFSHIERPVKGRGCMSRTPNYIQVVFVYKEEENMHGHKNKRKG
jgi:hypothetical protein